MNELHRPRYHFLPPKDWLNDPKLFFRKGEYHLFYQYSDDPEWRVRQWGHAVSADLAHWRRLPVALTPTPGGPDHQGCWTGCVVEDGDRAHILYTGVHPQVQCLATSRDLIAWEKFAGNPVIRQEDKPAGFGNCFRDPCVWKEDGAWRMLIGSDRPGTGGAALLYESADLVHWRYLHPFYEGRFQQDGAMFECPDFFPLGGRHALLTSHGRTYWHAGGYAAGRFAMERFGPCDGGNFYAAKTLCDDRGRRLLWGWITDPRPPGERLASGWSGAMSLPREMTLRSDGTMSFAPVPEIEALRGRHWHFDKVEALSGRPMALLAGAEGRALEIVAEFAPSPAMEFGLAVLAAPDGSEFEKVSWMRDTQSFMGAPLRLDPGEGLALRVFVDHSIIESFANGRACHTSRAWPARPDRLGVGLYCSGGAARAESVDVWEMKGIW